MPYSKEDETYYSVYAPESGNKDFVRKSIGIASNASNAADSVVQSTEQNLKYATKGIFVVDKSIDLYRISKQIYEGKESSQVFRDYAATTGTIIGGKISLKLIRAISDWARHKGAEEIHIHTNSGIETARTNKLLTRLGFSTMGANYVVKI